MGVLGYLLLGIFLYFFYNLFVKVIWPIYKTTKQIRRQFKNLSSQNQEHFTPPPQNKNNRTTSSQVGEYIDFEEIKD